MGFVFPRNFTLNAKPIGRSCLLQGTTPPAHMFYTIKLFQTITIQQNKMSMNPFNEKVDKTNYDEVSAKFRRCKEWLKAQSNEMDKDDFADYMEDIATMRTDVRVLSAKTKEQNLREVAASEAIINWKVNSDKYNTQLRLMASVTDEDCLEALKSKIPICGGKYVFKFSDLIKLLAISRDKYGQIFGERVPHSKWFDLFMMLRGKLFWGPIPKGISKGEDKYVKSESRFVNAMKKNEIKERTVPVPPSTGEAGPQTVAIAAAQSGEESDASRKRKQPDSTAPACVQRKRAKDDEDFEPNE